MLKITKIEVEKISNLARIKIANKEKEKYSKELSDILGYVEKLNGVNTDDIKETSQVTGLTNVYRVDIATELSQVDKNKEINSEKLFKNAPSQKDGYIKVKAMLE
jgi:aspartyl-tRNA(Asn)/glutamyl-tRNA(Gln) amidotransferase subunit C